MKKEYMKPQMEVVELQHQSQLLAGSVGANSLNNADGFGWQIGGFDDTEGDY